VRNTIPRSEQKAAYNPLSFFSALVWFWRSHRGSYKQINHGNCNWQWRRDLRMQLAMAHGLQCRDYNAETTKCNWEWRRDYKMQLTMAQGLQIAIGNGADCNAETTMQRLQNAVDNGAETTKCNWQWHRDCNAETTMQRQQNAASNGEETTKCNWQWRRV